MDEPLRLTEAETRLIVELLEEELHELPAEIHHTRTNQVREDLRSRKELVQHLLERLRPVAIA